MNTFLMMNVVMTIMKQNMIMDVISKCAILGMAIVLLVMIVH